MEKHKKMYLDDKGYLRFRNSKRLVHRWKAQKHIFEPNRHLYPKSFKFYVVHHKDGNKLNNDVSNLEILSKPDHENRHSILPIKWKIIIEKIFYVLFGVGIIFPILVYLKWGLFASLISLFPLYIIFAFYLELHPRAKKIVKKILSFFKT